MLLDQIATSARAPQADAATPFNLMAQLLFGKHITYSLSAVARLGVADHMGEEPISVDLLASKTGAQSGPLYRVMRLLTGAGVCEEKPNKCFCLKPAGELLKSDVPGSLRCFAIPMGDPWTTRPWEHFTEVLKTGVDGVAHAFGKSAFELLAEGPVQAANFQNNMTSLSAAMIEPILEAYDFRSIERLADIGGGHGMLLAAILNLCPQMTGVLYDLPEVVAGAPEQEHLARCENRIEFEKGSFFESVPAGCDAYLMKFILHDWSDEHCKTILRLIRGQLPANGRVLVLEQLVGSGNEPSPAKFLDIEMLALTPGGRERTETEFAELFRSAGLKLARVYCTESPVCILEARPADE